GRPFPGERAPPDSRLGKSRTPALHASAWKDAPGAIHVSIVNLDPNHAAQVAMRVWGATPASVAGRVLTASAMDAVNAFDKPPAVTPAPFTAFQSQAGQGAPALPSESVVGLEPPEPGAPERADARRLRQPRPTAGPPAR